MPTFKTERTAKMVVAAKRALIELRSSSEDPAQTAEAKAKRAASLAHRVRAAKEWERAHPGPHNRAAFIRDVLPLLDQVTLPAMMKATGLTSGYCFKIKRGKRVPHPMCWEPLQALTIT
jgi:hypothetical protein